MVQGGDQGLILSFPDLCLLFYFVTPGSAVRHISAAKHITDGATRPGKVSKKRAGIPKSEHFSY